MRLARRDFLRAGAVLSAAALTGCTTRQDGRPVPTSNTEAATTEATTDTSTPSTSESDSARVRLGVAEYRPYAYQGDSGLTGEVVEVAKAVCAGLDVQTDLEVVLTPYDQLLPKLAAGELDVVGALRLAPEYCAQVGYFVADHRSNTALVVAGGNPLGITTFTEVVAKGARLGVVERSLDMQSAQAAGVTTITTFPTAEVALTALVEGRLDCVSYDDITLHDMAKSRPQVEVRPSFEPPGGAPIYGFAFPEAQQDFAERFGDALTSVREQGKWLEVATPFGFTDRNLLTGDDVGRTCER